jgi:uroporphyrinogen-III synthase
MMLKVELEVRRFPLRPATRAVLRRVDRYDLVAFTSKNAQDAFLGALRSLAIKAPPAARTARVGPRAELLKLPLRNKRVLFPRSARAPRDIVGAMRAKGAVVRPLVLYTVRALPLSKTQRQALVRGKVEGLYFKSPSGVEGFLAQLRGSARKAALKLPARCIGATTASAARAAGFKKVSIAGIL